MYKLRDYQQKASDAAVKFFNDKKAKYNAIEVLPTGCHAKGTKIMMYDGSLKAVEDIKIGDRVMGVGGPQTVLQLHRGTDKMFRIIPKKGEPFVVNGGHILHLYKTSEGRKYLCEFPRYDEISVYDYIRTSKNYKHLHKLHRAKIVYFNNENKSLYRPYLLGLFLGDGSSSNGTFSITTMRKEIVEYLDTLKEEGYNIRIAEKKGTTNKAKSYFLSSHGTKSKPNKLLEWLKKYGLFKHTAGNKFIPFEYKTASYNDREQLLAGLLDTDSYYYENDFEYCTKSYQLAKDIEFLCRSLGYMCNIGKPKYVNEQIYYRMNISGNLSEIPTKVNIRKGKNRKQKKLLTLTGFDIEYAGYGEYYGFTLDGNHLYLDSQFFIHHNSGKSLIIADIANRLNGNTLVFQPSKEILEQNYSKMCSYGVIDCSVYSASFHSRNINRITFVTIGSVIRHTEDFKCFDNVIIDEAHGVNAKGGMYEKFISETGCKVLGLTATPYRLSTSSWGAMLKFITRTRPKIFSKVIYHVQISTLLDMGYLARLNYYQMNPLGWNENNLKSNSTGADYTDKSVENEYKRVDFYGYLVSIVKRLLNPKVGGPRHGILVFTRFLKEASRLASNIECCEMVSGETPKADRERILADFKSGKTKVVVNVGVLTTGFDYPELDTVVIARPTKSLALYYQMIGRAIRPFPGKNGWAVDLCGNIKRFGKVDDLTLEEPKSNQWQVTSRGRQLTNVFFQ